jgi:hypothetical protein
MSILDVLLSLPVPRMHSGTGKFILSKLSCLGVARSGVRYFFHFCQAGGMTVEITRLNKTDRTCPAGVKSQSENVRSQTFCFWVLFFVASSPPT